MNNTTRISDLPENVTMQINKPNNLIESEQSTNYIPINVHPNPYGISAQNPIIPSPQQQQQQQQPVRQEQMNEEQMRELKEMRQVNLPSKHVKIDTQSYLQDEEVQPNYIPRQKLTKDYILDYEEKFEKDRKENETKKHRESKIDALLSEFQIPFMIAALFMVFQLPIVNTLVFKRFSFLMIYNEDGNFNFYGLILKSILFGASYYISQKIIEY
jgi:hypothetical protein